jgi:porin
MTNKRNLGCIAGTEARSSRTATALAGIRAPGQRISVGFAIAVVTLLNCTISAAEDIKAPVEPGAESQSLTAKEPAAASHDGELWERDVLTGDWGGLRSSLEEKGLQLGLNYIGEVLGNPSGGVSHGAIYQGRLEMLINLDLEKALGWKGGVFHANAYQIQGRGVSTTHLGNNLLQTSNIEAARSTRLFDLWLQQDFFDGFLQVRAGQIAADDEFFISQYGANFVNATFGWPTILAANLPSGGPAYPLATPGARVKLAPTKELSFLAAAFNGDPAGPGTGNPQLHNSNGTSFRIGDGAFAIAEAAYALNQENDAKGLPATYKLGAWYHTGQFSDQRFDSIGHSLADPASTGIAAMRQGNFGFYFVGDQMIWREPDTTDQGLGVFLRLGGNPSDRNLVSFYADGGINYKGLLPDRGDDVFGIGIAFARIGDADRGFDGDARGFGDSAHLIRDHEMVVEVTYLVQLAPWWSLQPDAQYILHPGGNVAAPDSPRHDSAIGDAIVLGLRTTVKF